MNKLLYFIYCYFFLLHNTGAQEPLILFDEQHPTAKVIYEDSGMSRPLNTDYPVVGNYSPTWYANPPLGIDNNRGFCDYIYIPTDNQLEPGRQYTLKLTIRFDEAYSEMSFYQNNFGIALTNYLYPNSFPSHWGLWRHTHETLDIIEGGRILTIEREFRPLCTSKYFVLGVFRAGEMDHFHCFFCYYPFELFDLSISESKNPDKPCAYFGDEFKSQPQSTISNEVNIYFDSGSAEISKDYHRLLDSIPAHLDDSNDMILLSAFTDISGSDNEILGAARNEAVRQALLKRGVPDSRILKINHADSKAENKIQSTDRRVEIDLTGGKVYKKLYMAALEAAAKDDYPTAHKIMTKEWINAVPQKKALYSYYECWGESKKAEAFKAHLLSAIKSKFYRKQELRFKLDSLNCEWRKGRSLKSTLYLNRMPLSHDNLVMSAQSFQKNTCSFTSSPERDALLRQEADAIFRTKGFPDKKEVGLRANEVIPRIIMTSEDLDYLEKYLPQFKAACENSILKWKSYATLYDKVSILKNGFQRYGTRMTQGPNGPIPAFPFEDESLVDEYRRQVKLAPFTKHTNENISSSQSKIEEDLVTHLNNIYKADQHHRNRVNTLDRDFDRLKSTDSLNQIKVRKILDERGWLGPDIIGQRGSTTLFLVIQHSDLETQVKYLPMLRKAVKKGDAKGQDLALLEDRIALGQGKMQIYGSQIYTDDLGSEYVAPLLHPETVNDRRADVGLDKIEDYIRRWQITWDIEKQKIINEQYEKELKDKNRHH